MSKFGAYAPTPTEVAVDAGIRGFFYGSLGGIF
jgi:hypothetical protein